MKKEECGTKKQPFASRLAIFHSSGYILVLNNHV